MYNREGELTYKREEVCERYAIGLPVYYNREGELTYKRGEVSEMYVTSLRSLCITGRGNLPIKGEKCVKGLSSASQSMYNREGELTYKRGEVCERYVISLTVYV